MSVDVKYFIQRLIFLFYGILLVNGEYCPGYGAECPPPQQCCSGGSMCCTPFDIRPSELPDSHLYSDDWQFGVWNLWYFWFVVIFLFMACTGACAFWRHRRRLLMAEQATLTTVSYGMPAPQRQYPCPPSRLSLEASHGSLNRFSYFSTVLASSPSTQEPQGEFPSPPPYSEIGAKSSVASSNSYWKDLPPYPGGFDNNLQQSQSAGCHRKAAGSDTESSPFRVASDFPTSPPSYSLLSDAAVPSLPPSYRITPSRSQSNESFPSLVSTPSIGSGEVLMENSERPARSS